MEGGGAESHCTLPPPSLHAARLLPVVVQTDRVPSHRPACAQVLLNASDELECLFQRLGVVVSERPTFSMFQKFLRRCAPGAASTN